LFSEMLGEELCVEETKGELDEKKKEKGRKRTSRPAIPLTVSRSSPNLRLFNPVASAPSTSASCFPAARSIAATLPLSLLLSIVGSTSL
jgi:hypothetical protein